jgi:hypothetical protein
MSGISVAVLWIIAASILGFGLSAIFSGWLNIRRRLFLIPYILLAGAFLYTFSRMNPIDLTAVTAHNLPWGVVAGVITGAILIMNVRSQPATREATGVKLLVNLVWEGLAYGIMDGLLLNVMPVLALQMGFSGAAWTSTWLGKLGFGLMALGASLWITLAYHAGYREFRDKSMLKVLFGNAIITLAYLVSANPLGSLIAHAVMHLAAVLRGPETTLQLPPHVQQPVKEGIS